MISRLSGGLFLILFGGGLVGVCGQGRLLQPVSRLSMWRSMLHIDNMIQNIYSGRATSLLVTKMTIRADVSSRMMSCVRCAETPGRPVTW